MSQLMANTTTMQTIIEKLQGKASGGSGAAIETCTVTISFKYGAPKATIYVYSQYIDNNVQYSITQYGTNNTANKVTPVVLNNVVKGSIVVIYGFGQYSPSSNITISDCEDIRTEPGAAWGMHAFRITGDNPTIEIENSY